MGIGGFKNKVGNRIGESSDKLGRRKQNFVSFWKFFLVGVSEAVSRTEVLVQQESGLLLNISRGGSPYICSRMFLSLIGVVSY